jgi:hypothetical protein
MWLHMGLCAEAKHQHPMAIYKFHNFKGDECFQIMRWLVLREDWGIFLGACIPQRVASRHLVAPKSLWRQRHAPGLVPADQRVREVFEFWWKVRTRSYPGDGLRNCFGKCICCRCRQLPDAPPAGISLVAVRMLLVTAAMRVADARVQSSGSSGLHVCAAEGSAWAMFHADQLRARRDYVFDTVEAFRKLVWSQKLFLSHILRFHIEHRRYDDGGIAMRGIGTSALLVTLPATWFGGARVAVVQPIRMIEIHGAKVAEWAGSLALDDCLLEGGLPFVYGTLFLPESAADARTLLSPWTRSARLRQWRAAAIKTDFCWAFPLAWAERLVSVVHDHRPCFFPAEKTAAFYDRVMDAHGQTEGCGPWTAQQDWECDPAHNRHWIRGSHDGTLMRLASWHRFAES